MNPPRCWSRCAHGLVHDHGVPGFGFWTCSLASRTSARNGADLDLQGTCPKAYRHARVRGESDFICVSPADRFENRSARSGTGGYERLSRSSDAWTDCFTKVSPVNLEVSMEWTWSRKRYLVAVRPRRAALPVHGVGPWRPSPVGDLLVSGTDPDPQDSSGAGPDRRTGPLDPPDDLIKTRGRQVLPLDHLPVPASSVRGADLGRVAVVGDSLGLRQVGLALTVGTVAGIGINTATNSGTRRRRWSAGWPRSRWHSRSTDTTSSTTAAIMCAWPLEDRPAAGWANGLRIPSRTVVGSLKNAWRLEQPRFKRRDESHWSIRNDVLNAWLMSVVLWAALLVVFGIGILPYLLLQAAVGIVLLGS